MCMIYSRLFYTQCACKFRANSAKITCAYMGFYKGFANHEKTKWLITSSMAIQAFHVNQLKFRANYVKIPRELRENSVRFP